MTGKEKDKMIEMLNDQIRIDLTRIDYFKDKEAELYNALQEIANITDQEDEDFTCSTCSQVFDITQEYL